MYQFTQNKITRLFFFFTGQLIFVHVVEWEELFQHTHAQTNTTRKPWFHLPQTQELCKHSQDNDHCWDVAIEVVCLPQRNGNHGKANGGHNQNRRS